MNLTWHIVRKDLRRMWIPAALLASTVIFKLVCGLRLILDRTAMPPASGSSSVSALYQSLHLQIFVAIGLEIAVTWFTVPLLLDEDSARGTTASWKTRPIQGGRMFRAKLLAATLLYVALPVMLTLPWWLYNGFSVRDVMTAAIETAAWQGLVIVPALGLASLTRGLKKFLGLTLLLLALLGSWAGLVIVKFAALSRSSGGASNFNFTADSRSGLIAAVQAGGMGPAVTGLGLFVLLGLGGAVALLLRQYRMRRAGSSALAAVLGLGCLALLSLVWRWDWTGLLAPSDASGWADGVTMRFREANASYSKGSTGLGRGVSKYYANPNMSLRLELSQYPSGYATIVRGVAAWQWGDGTTVQRMVYGETGGSSWSLFWSGASSDAARRLVLGPSETTRVFSGVLYPAGHEPRDGEIGLSTSGFDRVEIDAATYAKSFAELHDVAAVKADPILGRFRRETPNLRLRNFFTVQEQQPVQLPLRAGRGSDLHSGRIAIEDVREVADHLIMIAVREQRPALVWDDPLIASYGLELNSSGYPSFRLQDGINRRVYETEANEFRVRGLRIAGVVIFRRELPFSPRASLEGKTASEKAAWREKALLALTDSWPVAGFSRALAVEHFELKPPADQAGIQVTGAVGVNGLKG